MLDSVEAELTSRLALEAASKVIQRRADVQHVDGFAYFGAASDLEHAVAGRFSLSRAEVSCSSSFSPISSCWLGLGLGLGLGSGLGLGLANPNPNPNSDRTC